MKIELKDIMPLLLEIFPELPEKDLGPGLGQATYPLWDSFAHMQLVSKLEETYQVQFSMDEAVAMDTVAQILTVLNRKLSS